MPKKYVHRKPKKKEHWSGEHCGPAKRLYKRDQSGGKSSWKAVDAVICEKCGLILPLDAKDKSKDYVDSW